MPGHPYNAENYVSIIYKSLLRSRSRGALGGWGCSPPPPSDTHNLWEHP